MKELADIKIELNHSGIRSLLRSGEMEKECGRIAGEIAGRATAMSKPGAEYGSRAYVAGSRAVAVAFPESAHAYYSNRKHNTLLKAMQ